ncbi:MAG: hypothetical protein ACLPWS_00355 [Rhodomicrobium sp.]
MKTVAVLGGKGGTTKTATSHLICLGAHLSNVPAAYALTDPLRKVREQGRPYAVLDGRLPEQLALILDASRSNLNGWLVIDGGGNRPDFDIEVSKNVDLTVLPFRASEEDIDATAQSLATMPRALALPSAWPTNSFAFNAAQYLLEGLGKAFPHRIISPPIPFVNSISDLLAESLTSPSTAVRQAARRAFETISDYYEVIGEVDASPMSTEQSA